MYSSYLRIKDVNNLSLEQFEKLFLNIVQDFPAMSMLVCYITDHFHQLNN